MGRVVNVNADDLVGVIDLAARYSRRIPDIILSDPRGFGKHRWRPWINALTDRIEKAPPRGRLVPRCHQLGKRPVGYDWDDDQCADCAVKLTCIVADEDLKNKRELQLRIHPDVSEDALRKSVIPDRRRKKLSPTRYRLVYRNPWGNYTLGAIWDIYPSGMSVPKVYPRRIFYGIESVTPLLYRVRVDNVEHSPVLTITAVYRAQSACEAIGSASFKELEQVLEYDPDRWAEVELLADPVPGSPALASQGIQTHIQAHVRNAHVPADRVDLSGNARGYTWQFWNMMVTADGSEVRHIHAKRVRREGVKFLCPPLDVSPRCPVCHRAA